MPLSHNLSHGLWRTAAYPAHEVSVKSEPRTALLDHEPSYVLRALVAEADHRMEGDLISMPIEVHRGGSLSVCIQNFSATVTPWGGQPPGGNDGLPRCAKRPLRDVPLA